MKKTPLNQSMRYKIRDSVLDHRFGPIEKRLAKVKAGIGKMFYDQHVSAHWKKVIAAAPIGFFADMNVVAFQVMGEHHRFELPKYMRCPDSFRAWSNESLHVDPSIGVGKVVIDYYAEREKVKQDRQAAFAAVGATLSAFKYVEDLIRDWPEVKPFIPKTDAPVSVALAIPPKQLNEMLGL